jgi:hypothetical protein
MTLLPRSRSGLPTGGLVAAQRKGLYDDGWKGGGMWLWTVIGVLVVVLLVVVISKVSNKQ